MSRRKTKSLKKPVCDLVKDYANGTTCPNGKVCGCAMCDLNGGTK